MKDIFVEELSDTDKLYIFPLFHEKIMVLKVCEYMALINVIEEVMNKCDFIQYKERNISGVTFEGISGDDANVAQAFLDEHGYKSSQTFEAAS